MTSALVIGLGERERGDDAVGPEVAGRVAALHLPGVRACEVADPAALLDAWAGADVVVVTDAMRSGRHHPGTVQVRHACHQSLPVAAGAGSTHALGLAEVIELARALGRMPPELVVVAVEAEQFGPGAPLSPAVRSAVETAVTVVTEVIRCARGNGAHPPGP